jgi:hypothetical protein
MAVNLPYVHEFVDRHGKLRRYFRRRGYERVPLPTGPVTDPEFIQAYQAALAGETARIERLARLAFCPDRHERRCTAI